MPTDSDLSRTVPFFAICATAFLLWTLKKAFIVAIDVVVIIMFFFFILQHLNEIKVGRDKHTVGQTFIVEAKK